MDTPPYVLRRIDHSSIELLPDGSICIWEAGSTSAPIVLGPQTAHAIYLFCRLPGVAPALRQLDDLRQRQAWERRSAAGC